MSVRLTSHWAGDQRRNDAEISEVEKRESEGQCSAALRNAQKEFVRGHPRVLRRWEAVVALAGRETRLKVCVRFALVFTDCRRSEPSMVGPLSLSGLRAFRVVLYSFKADVDQVFSSCAIQAEKSIMGSCQHEQDQNLARKA